MLASTQQAAIFVGSIVGVSAAIALGLRLVRHRGIRAPESMSLADAAKFAYGRARAERLPIANVAEFDNTWSGALAWFAASLRHVLRLGGDDGQRVTRSQLRRYFRWARAVQ